MKLGELLMKDFKDDVIIFDKNNCIIASGNNDDLFDMLGYYFLDLKVLIMIGNNVGSLSYCHNNIKLDIYYYCIDISYGYIVM